MFMLSVRDLGQWWGKAVIKLVLDSGWEHLLALIAGHHFLSDQTYRKRGNKEAPAP